MAHSAGGYWVGIVPQASEIAYDPQCRGSPRFFAGILATSIRSSRSSPNSRLCCESRVARAFPCGSRQRRHEELFDTGAEAFAVDGPIEEAGRVAAVVAQGGQESRDLTVSLRDFADDSAQPRSRVRGHKCQLSNTSSSRQFERAIFRLGRPAWPPLTPKSRRTIRSRGPPRSRHGPSRCGRNRRSPQCA